MQREYLTMKLGISSYTFTWAVGIPGYYPQHKMGVMELLDKAVELDVKVLQIADNLPLDRLSDSEIDSLAKFASGLKITIEVGTRGILNNNLLTYLRLAERLNSPIVRVVLDSLDYHPSEDEVINIIKPIMPEFGRVGISLAIENYETFNVKTLKRIVHHLDNEYAGICLDNANSFGSMDDTEKVVEELGPLAVNLHVKGFKIYRANHNMGFIIEGTSIDKGMLDLAWFFDRISEFGRDYNVILEQWTPFENDVYTTIEKENSWAKTSIEYLCNFITV
jgi:sugar phosphate isomerase/epimerase